MEGRYFALIKINKLREKMVKVIKLCIKEMRTNIVKWKLNTNIHLNVIVIKSEKAFLVSLKRYPYLP